MLDPRTEEASRDALAEDARSKITAAGEVTDDRKWGMRKLAYEIEKQTEADYRWFRFTGPTDLLSELDHSLKIADGVLRFRIFRVEPGTTVVEAPPPVGAVTAPVGDGGEDDE